MPEAAVTVPAVRERRSPTPAAVHKREAIRRLKSALSQGRFVIHFQPIVRSADGRADRVEALLRWREEAEETDELTLLVTAAERSPVIFKLENWTVGEALRGARTWREAGLSALRVHANLSAREFARADLVRRLTRLLATAGVPPAAVSLEVTETSSISDFTAVAKELHRLDEMGLELWLDDFGTGHSSLEWLSHLPCHGLKIPGTFVERLSVDERCRTIVKRVIELAHDLRLQVVAEGVETAEQRDFLVGQGCDLLQGFLFYASMPAGKLAAALSEGAPSASR
jgi:diguanylate cyclase